MCHVAWLVLAVLQQPVVSDALQAFAGEISQRHQHSLVVLMQRGYKPAARWGLGGGV